MNLRTGVRRLRWVIWSVGLAALVTVAAHDSGHYNPFDNPCETERAVYFDECRDLTFNMFTDESIRKLGRRDGKIVLRRYETHAFHNTIFLLSIFGFAWTVIVGAFFIPVDWIVSRLKRG